MREIVIFLLAVILAVTVSITPAQAETKHVPNRDEVRQNVNASSTNLNLSQMELPLFKQSSVKLASTDDDILYEEEPNDSLETANCKQP